MARIINNKHPLDLNDRKIVGFDLPINGDAVFRPTYNTKDQIKANLVNFLLTNKGERVFRPNYGADLRSLLFEQITDNKLEDIKSNIEEVIGEEFPMIKINKLEFHPEQDINAINFYLEYSIDVFGFEDEVNILIQ